MHLSPETDRAGPSDLRLAPELEDAGYRLISLPVTGSTNEDALRAARDGDPGPLWIVAAEQQAGRGRHGRSWTSPPGNLYASLLLIDPCEPRFAPQLGFVTGLALHQAIEGLAGTGAPRLALKWPNDLLLDGAKLAGILLEGHRIDGRFAVVVGCGVNVASAPEGTPYRTASLQDLRPGLTREALFPAFAAAFARCFSAWQEAHRSGHPDPFAATRRLWLARAAGIGTEVTLRLPSGERRGRFAGLDPAGRLELDTGRGLELIDAGDLYFPAPHPRTAELPAGTTGS
ncbi:MAG TPA: biotin--[acetyl-CoA-carboxylase] ligase [Microvirga sp.]|nr:biotin--[acetyl-CoA-carboxylase] ligase [Microvirga sp.]